MVEFVIDMVYISIIWFTSAILVRIGILVCKQFHFGLCLVERKWAMEASRKLVMGKSILW